MDIVATTNSVLNPPPSDIGSKSAKKIVVTIEEDLNDAHSRNEELDHSQVHSSHESQGSLCKKKKRRRKTGQQATNNEFDPDLVNDYRNHMKLSEYQKKREGLQSFAKKRATTILLDEVLSTSNY